MRSRTYYITRSLVRGITYALALAALYCLMLVFSAGIMAVFN